MAPTTQAKKKKEPQWGDAQRFSNKESMPEAAARVWYWCGTFPTCPKSYVNVGAATFTSVSITKKKRKRDGGTTNSPSVGGLMHLSKYEVKAIADSIARTRIRFGEGPERIDVDGKDDLAIDTDGVDMLHQKRRRGALIRIHTEAEVDAIRKNGGHDKTYQAQAFDELLADHLYMIPCEDQNNPRGEGDSVHGVDPISQTGIVWPLDKAEAPTE